MTTGHNSGGTVRVLGIDPGTSIVGWAVVTQKGGRQPQAVAYGAITTTSGTPMPVRLAEIATDLEAIIEEYHPTELAIEQIFYFRNQTTIIGVAQGRGVALLTGVRKGLTIAEYTPLQVKQAVTGYGRADKAQVQQLVRNDFS